MRSAGAGEKRVKQRERDNKYLSLTMRHQFLSPSVCRISISQKIYAAQELLASPYHSPCNLNLSSRVILLFC